MRNISVIMAANVESMTEKGDHSFGTLLSNVEYLSTTTGKSVQKYELYIVYTKNQGSHFHFFFLLVLEIKFMPGSSKLLTNIVSFTTFKTR